MNACHIPIERPSAAALRAACHRLLRTEEEINSLPQEIREWFISKPGHREAFALARFALRVLNHPHAIPNAITAAGNELPCA